MKLLPLCPFLKVTKIVRCQLQEQHFNMLQYELKSENISLAYVFCQMEQALRELPIEEYSVCQNTLDNVSDPTGCFRHFSLRFIVQCYLGFLLFLITHKQLNRLYNHLYHL